MPFKPKSSVLGVELMATRTPNRSYYPLENISIYHTVVGVDGLYDLGRRAKETPGLLRAQSSPSIRESFPMATTHYAYFLSICRVYLGGLTDDKDSEGTIQW
jgi:hypothetical protein